LDGCAGGTAARLLRAPAPGTAEVIQGVHRGPDGPPAEQHVIYQDHRFPGHVEWNDRRLDVGRGPPVKVVPVHADIQAANGDGLFPYACQQHTQPLPKGAEIVRRQGRPMALWRDRQGRKHYDEVTTGRQGQTKEQEGSEQKGFHPFSTKRKCTGERRGRAAPNFSATSNSGEPLFLALPGFKEPEDKGRPAIFFHRRLSLSIAGSYIFFGQSERLP